MRVVLLLLSICALISCGNSLSVEEDRFSAPNAIICAKKQLNARIEKVGIGMSSRAQRVSFERKITSDSGDFLVRYYTTSSFDSFERMGRTPDTRRYSATLINEDLFCRDPPPQQNCFGHYQMNGVKLVFEFSEANVSHIKLIEGDIKHMEASRFIHSCGL